MELADEHSGLTILQRVICSADEHMVDLLVNVLNTDLENHGNTTGWTSLWLACATGQSSILQKLLAKGANVQCRDDTTGFTVFHLLACLSQASDVDQCVQELAMRMDAIGWMKKTSERCLTPLHMAFVTSGSPNAHACKFLLNSGADPTAHAEYGSQSITPISQCAARLDPLLLKEMLDCHYLSCSHDLNISKKK